MPDGVVAGEPQHSFSYLPLLAFRQLFQLFACPTHTRLYISCIQLAVTPQVSCYLDRGMLGDGPPLPCRGYWQQRQLVRPLQGGGGPGAKFFGQPINIPNIFILQLHFAAFTAFRRSTKHHDNKDSITIAFHGVPNVWDFGIPIFFRCSETNRKCQKDGGRLIDI